MKDVKPLIIGLAPNGARYTKDDHPALPITPEELAQTAEQCLQAGARMIHLHVRDEFNQHSLATKHYQPALAVVREAVADNMLIQVTSESAGLYNAHQQRELMLQLKPDFISIALREFISESSDIVSFKHFIKQMMTHDCLFQYILYDNNDYELYRKLIDSQDIPDTNHSLLFVLGRYQSSPPTVDIVAEFAKILQTDASWMVCTFGKHSHEILTKSVAMNCHVRLGFENGFYLPDGTIASCNADLVKSSQQLFKNYQRPLADIQQTRVMLGQTT